MIRAAVVTAWLVLGVLAAEAQSGRGIQWTRDVKQGIATAQQNLLPMMFYVVGPTSDRPDAEKDQRRAFQDRRVLEQAKRFVPIRISRSQHQDLLEKWGMSPNSNLDIVFVSPAGEKIDMIGAGGAGNPESLANKMFLVFQQHRNQIFSSELAPVLQKPDASAADMNKALKVIEQFVILTADQTLVSLLERPDLDQAVRKRVYEVLAVLSTPTAVQGLLDRSAQEPEAAAALTQCTPAAAEQMLGELGGEDPARHLITYKAVTQICRIREVKPDKFWEGTNTQLKQKELERVKNLVQKTAKRWSRENEYR